MFRRDLEDEVKKWASKYPALVIQGPRQSGKTTLAQQAFPKYKYVSLEELDIREAAQTDPRKFLKDIDNEHGVILDEFQNVPTLLSYIQTKIDQEQRPGFFILSGSQNFLVNQAVSQSLAGRISIFTLLPLSVKEFKENNLLPDEVDKILFMGGYPRIYFKEISPQKWYPDYIMTYLERDVRTLQNVNDLSLFKKFIQLCAGRIGQLLNISSLSTDCGISVNTAKSWLSLLEASYIICLLQPHYKNFSKRLVKAPKIYFYDTGLACALLGIENEEQLSHHYLRGGLFESFVISELFKNYFNTARIPRLYFWRDNHGYEIDCIIERALDLIPIEVKAGLTISSEYFSGINYWNKLSGGKPEKSFVVYGGLSDQHRSAGTVLSWQSIPEIFTHME